MVGGGPGGVIGFWGSVRLRRMGLKEIFFRMCYLLVSSALFFVCTRMKWMAGMARATSAAPTYFEPKALQADNHSFLMADGGLFAKNPALQAFLEAQKAVVVQGQDRLTADDILLVSIGTGDCKEDYSFENIRKKGAFSWLKPLMRIMMSTGADVMNGSLLLLSNMCPVRAREYT
jgi:hypothetical protein